VVKVAAAVATKVFDEAQRRDPGHCRKWVALVDGNHQIDRIETEARARGTDVTIVVDFIHVLEYLWGEVWCFFLEDNTLPRPGYATGRWPCWKAAFARLPPASGDGRLRGE
jgi:hypothetical protein